MKISVWQVSPAIESFHFSEAAIPSAEMPGVKEWCDYLAKYQRGPNTIVSIHTRPKACAYCDYLLELGHEVLGMQCLFDEPAAGSAE